MCEICTLPKLKGAGSLSKSTSYHQSGAVAVAGQFD